MVWRTLSILKGFRWLLMALPLILGLTPSLLLAEEPTPAGKTIMAKGEVTARDEVSQRNLQRRAPVFQTDYVATGELSATQLRMSDGALLSLQASSELAIPLYEFNPTDQNGQVQMTLIKGGLRTITGSLKQKSQNYKLITPVASIGVRGTHYEAEMIEDDLYLAAWQGSIDIEVTVGQSNPRFALGEGASYQFAIVRSDGSVEFPLQTPTAFSAGHSSELLISTDAVQLNDPENQSPITVPGQRRNDDVRDLWVQTRQFNQDYIDNDLYAGRWIPESPLDVSRTGNVTYDQVMFQSVTSSVGAIEDFAMSFTVDFDAATVPTGNLSFSDAQGEWFAAFNGLLDTQGLNVDVNFASHGNQLATGSIEGLLIDQAQGILGNLSLFEINAPEVNADGAFELRAAQP
jgi:hypothetical protein